MALAAGRESLSANQGDLMGQAMLRVDHAVDPALGDRLRALIEVCHTGCAPEKRSCLSGFSAQGVSMQGPLVELEHFRELLKYLGTWPVSSPVLARVKPCISSLPGRFSAGLSVPFLFKTSPFFSSSCHGARCRPALLMPGILPAVKQVMESNQLLR